LKLRLPGAQPPAGKVASDLTAAGRLFIADSTNNRIVLTDAKGRFLEAIGCGAPGLVDGGYEEAALYRPQGVAYSLKVGSLRLETPCHHAAWSLNLRCRGLPCACAWGMSDSTQTGQAVAQARGKENQQAPASSS
jgi:hypothetical protein